MAWNVTLLRAGAFKLDAGCMFGIIPSPVWKKWCTPDQANRMPLQTNSLLLERDGRLVVVEVGIGDKFGEKERSIYAMEDRAIHDALHEADCDPKDVDAVIVTHLHFDHAGGLTRHAADGPTLTFPNAEIIVQRREWEDAIANRSTMHKTYLKDHLTPEVAERVTLVDGEDEVLPGVHVWPVPGHTWGQQAVRIDGGRQGQIVFVPDVMPTKWHSRPSACMAYDVEAWTSQQERAKLLRSASEKSWKLVLDHEHGHPVFTTSVDPDRPGEHILTESDL